MSKPLANIPVNFATDRNHLIDMKTTRNCKDLSRAERKARKRKLENTIPALPNNGDEDSPEIKNHSMPDLDSQIRSPKKRKRDDYEATMGIVRSKKVGILASTTERNSLKKPLQKHGGGGRESEHFNADHAISQPTRLAKRMDIGKTSAERNEQLTGISTLPDECHFLNEPQKKRRAKNMAVGDVQDIASKSVTSVLGQETSEAGDEQTWEGKVNENIRIKGERQKDKIKSEVTERLKAKETRFIVFIGQIDSISSCSPTNVTGRQSAVYRQRRIYKKAFRCSPPKICPTFDKET